MSDKYEVLIGLEIHAQLKTKSKMFCSCPNGQLQINTDKENPNRCELGEEKPNSRTCPVCMGMPGTLPVINRQALEWTFLLGLALNCEVPKQFNFERKQYFYPDLPKGYQITSQTTPPLVGGYLELLIGLEGGSTSLMELSREVEPPRLTGTKKRFTIEHVHLEEDAGKLIHADFRGSTSGHLEVEPRHSLVDLNRAGTPLLEIVSNHDFRSPQEAKAFMQELRLILRYLRISDADMEKGHLRCDANISLRKVGAKELGKKAEVKNMNSFASLEKALTYEIERQSELLDKKQEITQETRGWDEAKGITVSQRSKEYAHDYRYFPEPDLPPLRVGDQKSNIKNKKLGDLASPNDFIDLNKLKKMIPELPADKRKKYEEKFGLAQKEADILVSDLDTASYLEKAINTKGGDKVIKKIANWLLGDALGYLNAKNQTIADLQVKPEDLISLINKIDTGEISSKIAKEVFIKMAETGETAEKIIKKEGLKQVSDTGELEKIIFKILKDNPKQVADYKSGKQEALNWFVGQAMKATRGQANPGVVMEVLGRMLR